MDQLWLEYLLGQTILPGSLILVILVVLAVCGLALWGLAVFRRRLREPEQDSPIGFTLSDLRQLHGSGQMTTEEYERAREKLLGAARPISEAGKPPAERTPRPHREPGA